MKRKPNSGASAQRVVADRYGLGQRGNLYSRLAAGRPFGLFVIDGRLSMVDHPSPLCSGLELDHGKGLVGIYTEMPTWSQIIEDLDETEKVIAREAAALAA